MGVGLVVGSVNTETGALDSVENQSACECGVWSKGDTDIIGGQGDNIDTGSRERLCGVIGGACLGSGE